MIDTWLVSALVLGILALGVIVRSVRSRSPEDRLVAGTVAVALVSMTALTLSIASGTLVFLELIIIISVMGFALMIWAAKQPGADRT